MNPIHTYLKQHLNSNEQDTIIREIRKISLENEHSGYPIKDLLDALAYATKDADAAEYLSFNWHIDIDGIERDDNGAQLNDVYPE